MKPLHLLIAVALAILAIYLICRFDLIFQSPG